jgi:TolB-like protein
MFDNLSGDPEQEYFADGTTVDLISGLAKNPASERLHVWLAAIYALRSIRKDR